MKRSLFAVLSLTILFAVNIFPLVPTRRASAAGSTRDFCVTTEYDLGGQGFNVFYPQTLVVEQGDQVNITIRNAVNESFRLSIEGQNSVTVQPGNQEASGIQPVDTAVPVFTASTAGIFDFSSDKYPEMNGQIVVLPTDPTSYNPSTQTRSFTQLVLPDFSGDGYDKFFPALIVVNQGDTVNVSIRNTDDMPHGFAVAAYDMNVAVDPGQDQPDGSIMPYTTSIEPFTASEAGVFRWFCTTPCGPGHFEMVGQLIVLPTQNTVYNPDISTVYSYMTIKPDFAGQGYSKYVPDTLFANQNDFVYIRTRNTDVNAYNFYMPDYNINVTIAPGNYSDPSETYVPPSSLFADNPGVFEFSCGSNCSQQSSQMNGYLVVLPTQNATTTAPPPSTSLPFTYAGLSVALTAIGIVVGVVAAAIFTRERSGKTN
jgi:heme/copper-type cytochrome/quinol oxidase subunit 2